MKINKNIFFVNLFFISYACCLTFMFDADQRNLGLFALMTISIFILFIHKKVIVADLYLILLICTIIIVSSFFHANTRWSSIIYAIVFLLSHLSFLRFLFMSNYNINDLLKLVKFLIFAYFFVLILQQVSLFLGLPVFNNFGAVNYTTMKFNSLALEPSWMGRIMGLLMYVYIRCRFIISPEKTNLKEFLSSDALVWFAFLWSSISTFSATSIVFLLIIFFYFLYKTRNLFLFLPLMLFVIVLSQFFGFDQFYRTYEFALAAISLDPETMIDIDHSASYRVIPYILAFNEIDIFSFKSWLGNGVDYTSELDFGLGTSAGAGLLTIALDYGLFTAIIYILFSVRSCIDIKNFSTIIFWFFLVAMYGISFQIPWLTIMLLYTLKKVSSQYKLSTYNRNL